METKYIIVKDKSGHLRHFKSDWLHHYTLARDNGFSERDIVECGIFLDKENFIVECSDNSHITRRSNRYVGNRLNEYQNNRLKNWLKGRELESQLYFRKEAIGLREGD